jgi:hypothetical protein
MLLSDFVFTQYYLILLGFLAWIYLVYLAYRLFKRG